MIPNLEIAEEIGDLLIRCQFGVKQDEDGGGPPVDDPDGCREVIHIGEFKSSSVSLDDTLFDVDHP